jgi:myo-inositol-1(or 4)-monophosphatase
VPEAERTKLLAVMTGCGERVHEALLAAEFHRLAEIVGMGADGEHTTGIDQAAEMAALDYLERARPTMNILSEEVGYIERGAALTAVIDPIDATNNATSLPAFHHPEREDLAERITTPEQARHLFGYPYFAFSIGIFRDGEPIAGSVRNLPTGEVFSAVRGHGVELDGVPVHGSGRTTIEGARLGLIRPETTTALRAIEPLLVGLRTRVRIAGCSALDLALISCGVLDAVINPNRISPAGFGEKIVDYAGGLALLNEMGGVITHHDGSRIPTAFDLTTRAPLLAATTPELHCALRAMLDKVEWNPEEL